MRTTPFTIAVDFDGTLSLGHYPNIGEPNKPLFDYLNNMKENGAKIILWTCREYDSYLQEAIDFCSENGLEFDAVNENLKELGWNSRKVCADLYIDDLSSVMFCNKYYF